MLLEGQKVELDVHPDAIIVEDYCLQDGSTIYAVVGEAEQEKLFSLQEIINENIET
tara:strand:+ start:1668 stop:1835 length:168 start_codon:yes stop_codon:yes gene_type:complete